MPQGEARCKKCRMSVDRKRPNVYCTDCGTWVRYGDHPEDNRASCCHPCRRARAGRGENGRALACEECKAAFYDRNRKRRFCSTRCSGDYQSRTRQVRSADDCRVKRTHREHAAPGLMKTARAKLRAKWIRQQKPCVYCGARADTIDHVMPLVRGGTNYEGNLAPCCRRCNSSKSGKTVVEWRTGRTLPRMVTNPGWQPKPDRPKMPRPPKKRQRRLTDEQVREIRSLRSAGTKLAPLAKTYGVTDAMIHFIATGKSYADVM